MIITGKNAVRFFFNTLKMVKEMINRHVAKKEVLLHH